jgi:hypothetical protein
MLNVMNRHGSTTYYDKSNYALSYEEALKCAIINRDAKLARLRKKTETLKNIEFYCIDRYKE